MKLSDKIEYIRQAKEENRLVIFVGAGVSSNSGIPQWEGLIQQFAKNLVYYKCKKCEFGKKDKNCAKSKNCQINSDEYLKIPQYYYNKHKRKYFDIIRNVLGIPVKSNDLNRIIMQLEPKHIITTNYDKLIENTNSANRAIYKVIYKDEDLLDTYSNNYIIKMHGDIEEPENIVLKEDDYLSYSQKHILIETIIKSLLLDHTFLFVGYALNDYNLKLIMKWRDIIADSYKKSKDKCKSFIIDPTVHEKYEINYLKNNGVYVIDDKDITNDIVNKYSKDIKIEGFGKKVYSALSVINDVKSVMSDIIEDSVGINQLDYLYYKLQIFRNREKIALCELNNVIGINSLGEVLAETLVIKKYEAYKKVIGLIENNNEEANYIREIFVKSGILIIMSFERRIEEYTLSPGYEFSDMLKLLFQNNFNKIYNDAMEKPDSLEKAYYLYLCNPSDPKIEMILEKLNNRYSEENDIFSLMQLKLNLILSKQAKLDSARNECIEFKNVWNNIRESLRGSYKYLYNIFIKEWNEEEHRKEVDALERIYTREVNTYYLVGGGGSNLNNLYKLQRYSYEYYFYCKLNFIMIDHFSNIKVVLKPYIRGMMCTYTSKKKKIVDDFLGENQELIEYKLNKLDLEMLIKYTDNKDLKKYFKEYSIKKLNFDEEIDLKDTCQYFYNLCESIVIIEKRYMIEYIQNYLLVLSRCELKDEYIEKIIYGVILLVNKNIVYYEIIDEIIIFLRSIKDMRIKNMEMFINVLLNNDVISEIEAKNSYLDVRNLFQLIVSNKDKNKFDREVRMLIDDNQKLALRIMELNFLITEEYKKELKDIITNHLNIINSENLFRLLVDKYIDYDVNVENRFIYIIEENIKSKKNGKHKYIDWLAETLKFVVNLHLLGILKDLKSFSKYINYSIYIEFILLPNDFDYSKIHMEDYMWVNLFNSKKYRKILLKNGYDVIKEKLFEAIEGMYATEEEKSIYYKYFNKIYLY